MSSIMPSKLMWLHLFVMSQIAICPLISPPIRIFSFVGQNFKQETSLGLNK